MCIFTVKREAYVSKLTFQYFSLKVIVKMKKCTYVKIGSAFYKIRRMAGV